MNYLIDSNILIYASKAQQENLREWIISQKISASVISKIETLGYHLLSHEEETILLDFFQIIPVIQVSEEIAEKSIFLRRKYNLSLGDALIAATAQVHNLCVATANVSDFGKVEEITFINPL